MLLYSKPETCKLVTEIMTHGWSLVKAAEGTAFITPLFATSAENKENKKHTHSIKQPSVMFCC